MRDAHPTTGEHAYAVRVLADMYIYTGGGVGLGEGVQDGVQDGGFEKVIARLKDPTPRARVKAEMRDAHPTTWENLYAGAGPDGTLLLDRKSTRLNSSHMSISYAVFCLKKKKTTHKHILIQKTKIKR